MSEDVECHYLNRALADLKKARQLLPNIPSFYAKKAYILYEQQEFDEALKGTCTLVAHPPDWNKLTYLTAFDIVLTHDSYNDDLQRARDEAFK